MTKYKVGQIYKRRGSCEYFFILFSSDSYVKYYYLDQPEEIINRPLYTVQPHKWIFVQ